MLDYTQLLSGFEGKWVVISHDQKSILKSGNDIDAISEYIDKGIVMLVPESEHLFT